MQFVKRSELLQSCFGEAFKELAHPQEKITIVTKDGKSCVVNCKLLRFFSSVVNEILKDTYELKRCMLFIPDVSKESVAYLLDLLTMGEVMFPVSQEKVKEVRSLAVMLDIDLRNLQYSEKPKQVDCNKSSVDTYSIIPSATDRDFLPHIKAEKPEVEDEMLLQTDIACSITVKSDKFLQERAMTVIEPEPFLAPTPPSDTDSEISKSNRHLNYKTDQDLHKSKRSISEETMLALQDMMKDPNRKPTMEDMEELIFRANRFKHQTDSASRMSDSLTTSQPAPLRPDSRESRCSSGMRRSESRESMYSNKMRRSESRDSRSSNDSRPDSSIHSRSRNGTRTVSPKRESFMPLSQPSLADFQYVHAQSGNLAQIPRGQIQYIVQQGGTVGTLMPSTVPIQIPYSSVQGLDSTGRTQLMVPQGFSHKTSRSPSPVQRSSKMDRNLESGKKFDNMRKNYRSMAEKKASLLTMTVEEKRLMTCLDWNNGLCPRVDTGKLCASGGSKKKHVCSKIVKSSKFGGAKACWGKHREKDHKEYERMEYRGRDRDNRL